MHRAERGDKHGCPPVVPYLTLVTCFHNVLSEHFQERVSDNLFGSPNWWLYFWFSLSREPSPMWANIPSGLLHCMLNVFWDMSQCSLEWMVSEIDKYDWTDRDRPTGFTKGVEQRRLMRRGQLIIMSGMVSNTWFLYGWHHSIDSIPAITMSRPLLSRLTGVEQHPRPSSCRAETHFLILIVEM